MCTLCIVGSLFVNRTGCPTITPTTCGTYWQPFWSITTGFPAAGVSFIAAAGPNGYARFEWFIGSWIGRLILLGYTWALIHHMLGGIRHLIWDTGHGLGPNEREWLAAANLIGSITITIILWIVVLLAVGGPQ